MENPAINSGVAVSAISADPRKWRALLDQFEEVLKINICIINTQGQVLVPLNLQENQQGGGAFGASLLSSTFGIDFGEGAGADLLGRFDQKGRYLRMVDPFDFSLFLIPVKKEAEESLFYLVFGPVRLNKLWSDEKYLALAQPLGLAGEDFLRIAHSVTQMSEAALGAVLDLLAEVVRDVFELAIEKQKFSELQNSREIVRPEIIDAVQGLLADIQQDELLISVLDAAIKMAGAEGGSIMIFDEEKRDFVIKVSRGLGNKKNILQSRFKIGEGIAGIAAQDKTSLFISGTQGDARIQHLLKRPDIRQSFVVPILVGEQVIGILNLSIKDQNSKIAIEDIQEDIQKFSPMIAAALRSL